MAYHTCLNPTSRWTAVLSCACKKKTATLSYVKGSVIFAFSDRFIISTRNAERRTDSLTVKSSVLLPGEIAGCLACFKFLPNS